MVLSETTIEENFTTPARAILYRPTLTDSRQVYIELGRLWAQTRRAVECAPDVPADVAGDVEEAVGDALAKLFTELKPQIGGTKVAKRTSSIRAAYEEAYRGALAHAQQAADRAAASVLPPTVQLTPQAPVNPPGYVTPKETVDANAPGVDLVDVLLGRMDALTKPTAVVQQELTTGNDAGTTQQRAAEVPPPLTRAAGRLVGVGCPPLRVQPLGGQLATHILQHRETFTLWVEGKNLEGGKQREALTIARSLDLGTVQYGATYLMSTPAEVLLRRLLSLCLAARMGTFRLAQLLEELPGEGALAELPDDLLKSLQERLKLETKIEQLTAAAGTK